MNVVVLVVLYVFVLLREIQCKHQPKEFTNALEDSFGKKAFILKVDLKKEDQVEAKCAENMTINEKKLSAQDEKLCFSSIDLFKSTTDTNIEAQQNQIQLSNIKVEATSEMNERYGKTTYLRGTLLRSEQTYNLAVMDTDASDPIFSIFVHLTRSNNSNFSSLKMQWKKRYLSPFRSDGYQLKILREWDVQWPMEQVKYVASILYCFPSDSDNEYTEFGNYTLSIIDIATNQLIFVQNFEYDLRSPVENVLVSFYKWNTNVSLENATLDDFDGLLKDYEINPYTTLFQVNKTYLLICSYMGSNFDPEKAFIYWSTKYCSFTDEKCTVPIRRPEMIERNDWRLLPIGFGQRNFILGMAVVAQEMSNYGCGYNDSRIQTTSKPFIVADSPNGHGIYATEIKTNDNETTLRCIVNNYSYGPAYIWQTPKGNIIAGPETAPLVGFKTSITYTENSVYIDLIIANNDETSSGIYRCQAQKYGWISQLRRPVPSDPPNNVYSNSLNMTMQILNESTTNPKIGSANLFNFSSTRAWESRWIYVAILFPVCVAAMIYIAIKCAPTAAKVSKEKNKSSVIEKKLGKEWTKAKTNLKVSPKNVTQTEIKLGSGAFGVVFRAITKINGDEELTANKYMKDENDASHEDSLIQEINLMMRLGRHVNVLNLLGVVTKGKLCAILEYCEFGSLQKFLRERKNNYCKDANNTMVQSVNEITNITENSSMNRLKSYYSPVASSSLITCADVLANIYHSPLIIQEKSLDLLDLLSFACQIACGMEFLSSKKVIHGDLALRNLLLTNLRIVKIADFGLARRDQPSANGNQPLPLKWMAPEAFFEDDRGLESDRWSFGVVLWELFSLGSEPYPDVESDAVLSSVQNGLRMQIPADCPKNVGQLMQQCWNLDKTKRPSFDECGLVLKNEAFATNSSEWIKVMQILEIESAKLKNPSHYYKLKKFNAKLNKNKQKPSKGLTLSDDCSLIINKTDVTLV